MKRSKLFPILAIAVILSLFFQTTAAADHHYPDVIQLPTGWQAEGIALGYDDTFYAGSLATGAVYSGSLRTGEGSVLVPPQGVPTVGLAFDKRTGYLFAANGPSGRGSVFDTATGETLVVFQFTPAEGTFINDVIVTRNAAYFTNSARAEFYRVPLGHDGSLPGPTEFETVALTGEWEQVQGFNANGIEAVINGKYLLIVNSTTGLLYRVNTRTGYAQTVDLGGYLLTAGDGLAVHKKILYVVRNRMNMIAAFRMTHTFQSGKLVEEITNPNFDVPTTVAVYNRTVLYAVNAHFGVADPTTQSYEVVRVEVTKRR